MTSTPNERSRSPAAPQPWETPSRFGRRNVRFGPSGRSFEIAPAAGGCGVAGAVGGVVVFELALSLLGDQPKDAEV